MFANSSIITATAIITAWQDRCGLCGPAGLRDADLPQATIEAGTQVGEPDIPTLAWLLQ